MVEPITLGVGAVGAYLGKDGLEKLLGPTAEYLGSGLKDFTKKRVENIRKIFENAHLKLGNKIESHGQIPPKVLKVILDEGSFANDNLTLEYMGGILASSRSEDGRDDRGARISKDVNTLSTYQLRAHYLIYSTVKNIFKDSGLSLAMNDRPKLRIFMPFESFISAMDFSESEKKQSAAILSHIFFGLHADALLESEWMYGKKEDLMRLFPNAQNAGIICQPSAKGAELFLWAFGHPDKNTDYIFNPEFISEVDDLPNYVTGACKTS